MFEQFSGSISDNYGLARDKSGVACFEAYIAILVRAIAKLGHLDGLSELEMMEDAFVSAEDSVVCQTDTLM